MTMKTGAFRFFAVFMILFWCSGIAGAQYFGQNKPSYRNFRYKVKQTPNFEIYHYLDNESFLSYFIDRTEEWFGLHRKMFPDTFRGRNPLILYSTHADFQQTTAISDNISVGTGGVTEALKNRVIMPVAQTISQTDHVLGHEMVHAFQFNRLLFSDTTRKKQLNDIPLWMIEGMAEYFSIGSVDPNTAMWMRDALINKDFPTIKKLSTDSKYFPYRYGQALMAMIGKTWGDSILVPLLVNTSKIGLDKALDTLIGHDSKVLSEMWKSAMETYYGPYLKDSANTIVGRKTISKKNGGTMNISPSLSPDGKYLAFFSEKNVFSLDLFIAETETGKIIRKVSNLKRNHEIDDFNFVESAGTWSPDSRHFAFVVFSRGENKLAVVDVRKGKITMEIKPHGLVSFANPEWSPDGRYFILSGQKDGSSNLYLYDIEAGTTEMVTSDFHARIHPAWSSDGKSIVYSSEAENEKGQYRKYCFNISIMNVETRETRTLDLFPGAYNLNPRFSFDNRSVYFLSDADGFRNLYMYNLQTDSLFRLTSYVSGISGITPFSPAITTSRMTDLLSYSYFFNGNYEIYVASPKDFIPVCTDRYHLDYRAGTLPPAGYRSTDNIDANLHNRRTSGFLLPPDSVTDVPYRPKFKLDYISNSVNMGISTSRFYNNNMGGSVNMIFSDIVGNNQLYSSLNINGEIYDFSGQVGYLNQNKRLKWGSSVSHIPYRTGYMYQTFDSLRIGDEKFLVNDLVLDYIRIFEDNISLFAYIPVSQTKRFEAGASASWYYYRIDQYHFYYDFLGYLLGSRREKIDAPPGSNYQIMDVAYIEDNSVFGMTSPMSGSRSRIQMEKYFGAVSYYTGLIDLRKYYFSKPLGIAFRLYHSGRYGRNAETNVVYPLYIGYPWLVRGYEDISFYGQTGSGNNYDVFNVSNLAGSKILVSNLELRLPFSGPRQLALFRSKYFFTDLNLFFDAGLAWNNGDKIKLRWKPVYFNERIPVFSAGVSLRVNLLGAMIIEPYYAFPFQNLGYKNGFLGVNFTPGW